jgi:ubiquinone/menaquinone biosynthesis C-methylase UbiE
MPYFGPADAILDIGSGNGVLCEALRARGYRVTALDVADLSFIDSIKPVVYDGVTMPFGNGSFDVALLITVLHHTPDPDQVLAESNRVAARVIVIEEIYSNPLTKYLTYFIDSLFNFEFFGHPRSNRTDAGWRDAFQRLGFSVVAAKYSRSIAVLHRVTYVLERIGELEAGSSSGRQKLGSNPAASNG